jgi:hypothetical protein
VPPCVAYDWAKAVFVGKLTEITNPEPFNLSASFEVQKVFKGKIGKNESVTFSAGNCGTQFRVGEVYFVYKNHLEDQKPFQPFCDRTGRFSKENPDFLYAAGLSPEKPTFTISGTVESLSENERKQAQILIENGNEIHRLALDKYSAFHLTTAKPGTYDVKITLPFKAPIQVMSGNVAYETAIDETENQTRIAYKAEFKPNGCLDRTVKLFQPN